MPFDTLELPGLPSINWERINLALSNGLVCLLVMLSVACAYVFIRKLTIGKFDRTLTFTGGLMVAMIGFTVSRFNGVKMRLCSYRGNENCIDLITGPWSPLYAMITALGIVWLLYAVTRDISKWIWLVSAMVAIGVTITTYEMIGS